VGVDGQIVDREGACIFEKVAGHPVIFGSGGDVFKLLAKVAAKDFCATSTGRTDKGDGETLIVGHGDDSGFAVAREAFDGDVFGVDGAVGFEIVECATGAPSPSAKCAPIFERARLAFVDETNDAVGEAGAIVGLHTGGNERGVAPTFGEDLLLPGATGTVECGPFFGAEATFDGGENFGAEGKLQDDGNGRGGIGGSGEGELDVDGDERVRGIVDVADEFFGEDGDVLVHFARGADDFPADLGNVGRNTSENIAVEIVDNLRAALGPPDLSRGDLVAIFEEERIRDGVRADFGFVDVGGVRRFGIAVGSATKRSDVQEVEDALMILVGVQVDDGRKVGGRLLSEDDRGEYGDKR